MKADTSLLGERVAAKIRHRLVVPCAFLFLLSSIDRANVSFGALQMNKALGLSAADYGFGSGIFFVGYLAAQLPSVLLLERVGVRLWIFLITGAWGLAATALAFIEGREAFYALRIALGIAEAGLAPGMMLYLSRWSGERGRASLIAIPLMAIPMSLVIGGPLSGLLMGMHNPLAMEGWRWMFLVEGLPAIFCAFLAAWYLPTSPEAASWLNARERAWITQELCSEHQGKEASGVSPWSVLGDRATWLCTGLWFGVLAGNYGVIFWLPQALHGLSGLSTLEIGLVVALPWLANVLGIYFTSRHSDDTGERYLHMAIPCFIAAASLVGAMLAGATPLGLVLLIVLGGALGCALAPYWAIPFRLLPPPQRAIGISVINVLASSSGLIVPMVIGKLKDATNGFAVPAYALSAMIALAGVLVMTARNLEAKGKR